MLRYRLVDHLVPAMCLNLAAARLRATKHPAVRKENKLAAKPSFRPHLVNYFTAVKRPCALTFGLKLRPPAEIKRRTVTMATRYDSAPIDPLVDIRAMQVCLDELGDDAAAKGMTLAATLIGAASRAIADEIVERGAKKQAITKPGERIFNA